MRNPVTPLLLLLSLGSVGVSCAPADDAPGDAGPATDGTVVSEIAPVNPTGTVTGLVMDAATGGPLADVAVALVLPLADGAGMTTTSADGSYSIPGVPASSSIAVRYSRDGYFAAEDTVTIPSSAGNLAQDNGVGFSGPIGMLPRAADTAFVPRVIVRVDDRPPMGDVVVTAALEVAWLLDGSPRGRLIATVESAGNGVFSLRDLPDFATLAALTPNATLRVVSLPSDAATSPIVTTLSVAAAVAAGDVVVDIASEGGDEGGAGDLAIVGSNVADLVANPAFPSTLATADPVTVTFSEDVDADTFFASAIDSRGDRFDTTWSVDADTATITVQTPRSGEEVFVTLEAIAASALAGGDLSVVRASGFYVTPIAGSDPLEVRPYVSATSNNVLFDQTDRVTRRCLSDPNGVLLLELNGPVGARRPDGSAAPVNDLLPVRVTSSSVPDTTHPLHPSSAAAPVVGRLVDPPVGLPRSGFSTWVEVQWVPYLSYPTVPEATMQFSLVFNDTSIGSPDGVVVRTPAGAPVGQSDTGSVTFEIATCVPPP